ncbi:MAG TPA: helix-turn-helix domain-containing protein [Candidatus Nitrosocosmicus sp.]|nr:helix-turn-helix domain-containing protein [Candidatus Nitrosocosmicus sp.]
MNQAKEEEEERYNRILKALSNTRRRKILDLIKDQPRTTSELCNFLDELDRCTVMQHLGVLEEADLIVVKHKGKYRWNYINPFPIKEIHDRWISNYSVNTLDLLSKLKRDLE